MSLEQIAEKISEGFTISFKDFKVHFSRGNVVYTPSFYPNERKGVKTVYFTKGELVFPNGVDIDVVSPYANISFPNGYTSTNPNLFSLNSVLAFDFEGKTYSVDLTAIFDLCKLLGDGSLKTKVIRNYSRSRQFSSIPRGVYDAVLYYNKKS